MRQPERLAAEVSVTVGSDAYLIARIAAGDKAALAALYRAYERPLTKFIQSRLNDSHEASDIVHEVFMDVWRVAASFEGRSQVKTWMFGIAYRKVIDLHRKRSRVTLTDETPEPSEQAQSAEGEFAAREEAQHLQFCVGQLSQDHRSAISLAFYEDMTCAEIAEIVGVPEGTVKSRLFHARKLLQTCLIGRMGGRAFA